MTRILTKKLVLSNHIYTVRRLVNPMKVADGFIFTEHGLIRGHAVHENGVTELFEGPSKDVPDLHGVIVPSLIDAHTHCADAGVRPKPGMSLEELVAPPDGLKHVYLRNAPRDRLVGDMRFFGSQARANGIATFVDFREGGAEGCRMAREACPDAVILGRPISPEFDPNEIDDILSVADGIALSSLKDIDLSYAERIADRTHRAGKTFALHVSERVREDIDTVLALEPSFVVHMVEATDPDLRKCADSGVPIAVCPRSNRYFGKAPPLKRMMDIGNTVAIGTDNAMLCSPDLRPEADLFSQILGEGTKEYTWIWECMCAGGRKLLYRSRGIIAQNEKEMAFAVLPLEGDRPECAWTDSGPVIPFRNDPECSP